MQDVNYRRWNTLGTSHDGIDVTAWSPTGRSLSCPVKENDGVHTATFQPDETGEWSIAITHKGNHIQGGPFTCFVFDPNGIKVNPCFKISSTNIDNIRLISTAIGHGWCYARSTVFFHRRCDRNRRSWRCYNRFSSRQAVRPFQNRRFWTYAISSIVRTV